MKIITVIYNAEYDNDDEYALYDDYESSRDD